MININITINIYLTVNNEGDKTNEQTKPNSTNSIRYLHLCRIYYWGVGMNNTNKEYRVYQWFIDQGFDREYSFEKAWEWSHT